MRGREEKREGGGEREREREREREKSRHLFTYFREWFFLLSHEMLNPYYGLFEYAAR